MKKQAWTYLTQSWDRAERERERQEQAAHIFFEDIKRDDWVACSKLIERGCSPNMGLGQRTPAMVAAQHGSINSLRLLSKAGANLGAQDEQGRDALFWGVDTRSNEIIDFLLSQGVRIKRLFNDNSTPLIEAAKNSYVHAVRSIVAYDKNIVDACDRMGRTALWHVLSKTSLSDEDNEIARILMDSGADPDLQDLNGVTAREAANGESSLAMLERHDLNAEMSIEPEVEPQPVQPTQAPAKKPRL